MSTSTRCIEIGTTFPAGYPNYGYHWKVIKAGPKQATCVLVRPDGTETAERMNLPAADVQHYASQEHADRIRAERDRDAADSNRPEIQALAVADQERENAEKAAAPPSRSSRAVAAGTYSLRQLNCAIVVAHVGRSGWASRKEWARDALASLHTDWTRRRAKRISAHVTNLHEGQVTP